VLLGLAGGAAKAWSQLILAIQSPSTLASLRFSLLQAGASTILALVVGFPGAYFVARYKFKARRFFLSLAAVPFCLPPILVILSFILYYGKNGWFSAALSSLGLARSPGGFLYSFGGLVFIHAFYNFPIVIQNLGSVWSRMPKSREEAARTLGAGPFTAFLRGTLPYLLPALLQAASLIFLFCFFSFTIVLVFGGMSGSTLEVGIYRALRFTQDPPKALALGLLQTITALGAVWAFSHFDGRANQSKGFGAAPERKKPGWSAGIFIFLYTAAVLVFFLGPLASLVIEAFTVRGSMAGKAVFGIDNFRKLLIGSGTSVFDSPLAGALIQSLLLSGTAALAASILGLLVAAGRPRSWLSALPLALSPALISAGWGSALRVRPELLILIGQTAIAWPFVARSLEAAMSSLDRSKNEAARTLGAGPGQALLRVDIPAMAPSVASAAAFAFSLTMGDANIPLIVGGSRETLPLLLYRLTSSYRFSEACAVGIILAAFTSVAFFLKEGRSEVS
jgi:thiamine transport system permease protein